MTFRDQLRSYGRYHAIDFFGTFVTYAFFHASRKTLSNSKDSISLFWTNQEFNSSWPAPNEMKNWQKRAMFDSYEDASVYLGVLDTTFMACYSIGLFVSGWIGERVELRKFLAVGTLLNAPYLFTFGCILPWTNCTSCVIYWNITSNFSTSQVLKSWKKVNFEQGSHFKLFEKNIERGTAGGRSLNSRHLFIFLVKIPKTLIFVRIQKNFRNTKCRWKETLCRKK